MKKSVMSMPDAELTDCVREAMRRGLIGPLEAVYLHPDVVGAKVWTRADVKDRLQSAGFDGTEDEIDAVIIQRDFDRINDCLDEEWDVIDRAIENALGRSNV